MERTRTDRVLIQIVLLAIGGQLVRIFLGNNRGERHRDIGEERRFRTVQHELDGIIINLDKILDERAHLHAVKIFIGDASGVLVPRIILVAHAIKREDHVIRVEIAGRREMVARMELDALAQMEGIFQTIVADIPAFCQTRHNFRRSVFKFGKAVVNRMRRSIERITARIGCRIEAFRRSRRAIHEGFRRSCTAHKSN